MTSAALLEWLDTRAISPRVTPESPGSHSHGTYRIEVCSTLAYGLWPRNAE